MKRHPSLQPLSDDHHRALVLARRLQRAPTGMDVGAVALLSREVQLEFERELEPHFRTEEGWLLPALQAKGATGLAERTLKDHARLRDLAHGSWAEGTARALGALLQEHVRFEERVLFPKAEALLSEAELAFVRDAAAGGDEQAT